MLFQRVFLALAWVAINVIGSPITKHELPSTFTDALRKLSNGVDAIGAEARQFMGKSEVEKDSATVNGIVLAFGNVQAAFEGLADQLLDGQQPTFTPRELMEAHNIFDQLADGSKAIDRRLLVVKDRISGKLLHWFAYRQNCTF